MDGGREGPDRGGELEEGANISEVARCHGVVRGLLTVWRRKFATAASFQAPGSRSLPRVVRSGDGRRAGPVSVRA
ncbi:transposase [Bradyrhizobium brasilense]|uniref:transposase n=1 Tax=Bradyrhizobium brasilense TaxID=1419277 RepID=UPI003D31A8DD|nr:transposase [Bradyrhizobium brasilense]